MAAERMGALGPQTRPRPSPAPAGVGEGWVPAPRPRPRAREFPDQRTAASSDFRAKGQAQRAARKPHPAFPFSMDRVFSLCHCTALVFSHLNKNNSYV